jgi:UDP-N-acetyl-D-galactosamine dehydrogenase
MYKNDKTAKKIEIYPAVIGLGYVGFPIFKRLSRKIPVIGFDNSKIRVHDLKNGCDHNEFPNQKFLKTRNMFFSNNQKYLSRANFFIICVPTPIKKNNKPDLSHLIEASRTLAQYIKKGDIVFFESTVFPGVTKTCSKIIERESSLIENKDFFVGYSPERINPGDNKRRIENITKIVAFENKKIFKKVKRVYSLVSKKIIYSDNILEAETSKVIENIQRDLNIALINEIFIVCEKIGINFKNVMKLAETKWNFVKYQPGLVGGHCLPVDPYYFSYIASLKGVNTKIILAGRKVNNYMKMFIEKKIIAKLDLRKNSKKKILLCGLTYKENVSDVRNSQSLEIFKSLKLQKFNIVGYDPYLTQQECIKLQVKNKISNLKTFDKIIVLTKHKEILKKILKFNKNKIFFPFGN